MVYKTKWSIIAVMTLLIIACEGDEGQPGSNSLVNVVPESAGSACVNGGIKIEYGLDNDKNNVLSADEVQGHSLVCNGKDGADGANYLFDAVVEESGSNCQFGGYRLASGLDVNKNAILDLSEQQQIFYMCSARSYLLASVYENAGENCLAGGYKLNTGMDLNSNEQLDADEITSSQFICHGNNALTDKITRIEIPGASANTTSTTPLVTGKLISFNKSDYATDSIVFVSDPYTGGSGNSTIVELYNITDGTVISGSTLSTNATSDDRQFLFSENIFDSLPDKEITLGVRTRSSADGQFAQNTLTGLYLFIYKTE